MSSPRIVGTTTGSIRDSQPDVRKLVDRVTRVTGLPTDVVIEQLQNEQRDIGSSVRNELARRDIAPHVWSDELIEFYRSSYAMLFENNCLESNRCQGKYAEVGSGLLNEGRHKFQANLTFGDGLGFDSLALAQAGHVVDYYEVAENAIRFATDLFADAGVNINVINSPAKLKAGQYDAVVSLDVLEHVPDPCEVVDFLAPALRTGGHFCVHAPFYYLSPAVQTHLRSNRCYSGETRKLYGRAGLTPVDSAVFWNPLILKKTNGETRPQREIAATTRLLAGKVLLFLGRYWGTPYNLAMSWMKSQIETEWPELDSFKRDRSRTANSSAA